MKFLHHVSINIDFFLLPDKFYTMLISQQLSTYLSVYLPTISCHSFAAATLVSMGTPACARTQDSEPGLHTVQETIPQGRQGKGGKGHSKGGGGS